MKILDIDLDYFMTEIAHSPESSKERLTDSWFINSVWDKKAVINFIENNLGLSKSNRIKGRIIKGHNESLAFWNELINSNNLTVPFEVIHVDSHADLGLGYGSWKYVLDELLLYPVDERKYHTKYYMFDKWNDVGIGDYLLFAIAFRWISKITYCANPHGDKNDYLLNTLNNYCEQPIYDDPVVNEIQLTYSNELKRPEFADSKYAISNYFKKANKEPSIPFEIIPRVEQVNYNGDFDYLVLAQSPNYTPENADFILDVFRNYIDEI